MRWFKHDCDMHTNLKIQNLIDKEGAEGYAVWCLCLEMVGKEGKIGRIDGQKRWKKGLLKVFQWTDEGRLDKILNTLAEIRLINPKSLNYGNLHIPEFKKRGDDYYRRQLRTLSEESSPRIEQNRIDKIRREYTRLTGLDLKDFKSDDFARTGKAIKTLISKADGNDEKVLGALEWISKQDFHWTLETLIKKWVEAVKGIKDVVKWQPTQEQKSCLKCNGTGWVKEDDGTRKCECRKI